MAAKKKRGKWSTDSRWYEEEGDKVAGIVYALGTTLEKAQAARKIVYERMVNLYEGDDESIVDATFSEYDPEELNYNVTRSACDTVHAEIAGRQKPTAKFQTSGADWMTKRRAKKLEKFNNQTLQQRQGIYLNAWELGEACMLDSTIGGMGVIKTFARGGRINMERHYAHELYVDPEESKYGDPQNLFHIYTMERDTALWAFAKDPALKLTPKRQKEIEDAINSADKDTEIDPSGVGGDLSKSIKVVEAWRLPLGEERPGRHVFCINKVLLHDEEWTRPSFPFVILRWSPDRKGWYAKGLAQQGENIQLEINYNAAKIAERFRLCGSKRTYFEEGSIDPKDLEGNEAEQMIPVKPGAMLPRDQPPKPISESEWAWLQSQKDTYFEMAGVSQMSASARKEPGVTAAVAMRTVNDKQSMRFSLKAKAYESMYVALAAQIIHCARDAAADGDFKVARYDDEIKWSDLDLPEDQFEITIAPTSALPNDPAGRMQMTQELYEQQIISKEVYKQLLGWPDLEKEMDMQTSQRNYIEQSIDDMLDDESFYEPPEPMIFDKAGAMVQVSQAYFSALFERAPEWATKHLRTWLSDMNTIMEAAEEATMIAQATAQKKAQDIMMTPGPGDQPGPEDIEDPDEPPAPQPEG